METTQTDIEMEPPIHTCLPGIDDMIRAARPETCDSSATTVPPPSIQNKETCNDILETPPTALLSSLPAICDATLTRNASTEAASSRLPVDSHQYETVSGKRNTAQAPLEQPVKKTQRKKRRAPRQQTKTKQPRLGPQESLKKRGSASKRKNQNPKGKQVSTKTSAKNSGINDGEKAQFTGKTGGAVDKNASTCKETRSDVITENKICENSNKISGTKGSVEKVKTSSALSQEIPDVGLLEPSEGCGEVGTWRENDDKKEMNKCAGTADSGVAKNGSGNDDGVASEEIQNGIVMTGEIRDEQSLEEKYKDLSTRYTYLIRGILQEKPRSEESSDGESEEGLGKVVDRKIYDAVYLCKIGGMLGALKIDGGGINLVRGRIEGIDNAYIQVVKDGFEFVEGLMAMGEAEESLMIVRRVFRDLHIRLLMDVWEWFHVVDGGKALVVAVVKTMVQQMKKWYMMIINDKMSIRWARFITEDFVVILVRRLSNKDEKLVKEVVKTLCEVLKDISRYYQKCEGGSGSHEMFYNSCEVSVCIADGVPEAALALEEGDAFVIGRHNGVFARCVARLLAEREGEDGG